MKPLILLLLFISCKNDNKRPTFEIPINSTDTIDVTKKANYNIQKSPGQQHVFKVIARGDSAIVENKSK